MDVDLTNLSPQNHLEMMEMMMQLNKHPQLPSPRPYQDISDSSDIEFSSGSATSIETPLTMFHNPYLSTSTSSISFMGNPIQESAPANVPSNVAVPNFTNANEISYSSISMQKKNSMEAMREMIFRIAMMQPIHIDPESVKPPKRKNVKISKDPQSVAARNRRERISEKIRILQRLVPGGTKMDTASMLDEAVHYVKFLKKQVQSLEQAAASRPMVSGFPTTMSSTSSSAAMNYSRFDKAYRAAHMMGSMQMLS